MESDNKEIEQTEDVLGVEVKLPLVSPSQWVSISNKIQLLGTPGEGHNLHFLGADEYKVSGQLPYYKVKYV